MNPWKTPDVSMYHPHIWPMSLMSSAAVRTALGKSSVVKFGVPALTEFGNPKPASSMPARPTANLFNVAVSDRLGHALSEFIEFVVHNFRFIGLVLLSSGDTNSFRAAQYVSECFQLFFTI